jgi:hypothetical protein
MAAQEGSSWFGSLFGGSSKPPEPDHIKDTLLPPDPKITQLSESDRNREATKRTLQNAIDALKSQQVLWVKKRDMFLAEARKLAKEGRKEESRTAFRKASMLDGALKENQNSQCSLEMQLTDIEKMEVNNVVINAFKDTSKFMKESKKDTAKVDQVQDLMMNMTVYQAEREMVSDMITTTMDTEIEDPDEMYDQWIKEEEQSMERDTNKGKSKSQSSTGIRVDDNGPIHKKTKNKISAKKPDKLKALADDM